MSSVKKTIVLREEQYQKIMRLIPRLMIQTEENWNLSKVIRTVLDKSMAQLDDLAKPGKKGKGS